jgi:hypothetical protein
VRGDICTFCCGTEREVTVDCPLDCVYLQEARKHERLAPRDPREFPYPEMRITEDFLRDHEDLVAAICQMLLRASFDTPGTVDRDLREALASIVQTYHSLQSGLIYEAQSPNAVANRICRSLLTGIGDYRSAEHERLGMPHTKESEVFTTLLFLQRLELDRSNERPKGRAFIDFLREFFTGMPGAVPPAPQSSTIVMP